MEDPDPAHGGAWGPGTSRLGYRATLVIVLAVGLLVRLIHWWTVRAMPFFGQPAMDSQEYDRWAQVVASGDWLGTDVFFQAPLYPYALAVVYRIFGHSYDAVYLLQSVLAVAGCGALAEAARWLHADPESSQARRHALATGALATLYAPFVFYDVQLLKESPAVALTSFVLLLLVRARRPDGLAGGTRALAPWLGAGCLLGLLTLLRENVLLVLPFVFVASFQRNASRPAGSPARDLKAGLTRSAVLLGGVLLMLAPVALRNGVVGGSFLPTTFQGGTNFYIGNNPDADGTYRPIAPGKQIPQLERSEPIRIAEQDVGRELTPSEVSSYWLGRSLEWAASEPMSFLRLQVRKTLLFWRWYEWPDAVDYAWVRGRSPILWLLPVGFGGVVLLAGCGLWLRRHRLRSWGASDLPLVLWTVGWTASTVIFFVFSRYRIPAVPALLPWAAWPLVRLWESWPRSDEPGASQRRRPVALGWLMAALALLVPRALEPDARQDLVQYNLGVLYRDAGRMDEARDAFAAAIEADPDQFLAAMNLGLLAAAQKRWPEAEGWLRRALEIEPRSDDARANLGALLLATGRSREAEVEFRRVLADNPQHPQARKNLRLIERNFR